MNRTTYFYDALGNTSIGEAAQTLNGGSATPAILLGLNFFLNSRAVYQQNALLHEVLQAYTGGTDASIFATFAKNGLKAPGTFNDTENISAWLSTDSKSTPTSNTW